MCEGKWGDLHTYVDLFGLPVIYFRDQTATRRYGMRKFESADHNMDMSGIRRSVYLIGDIKIVIPLTAIG